MSEARMWKERTLWLAVVAALATALAWMAVVTVVTLVGPRVLPSPALTLARVFAHVAASVLPVMWRGVTFVAPGIAALGVAALAALSTWRDVHHV